MPAYYDEKTKTYYTSFYYKDFSGQTHRKLKRGFKLQREAKEYERNYIAKMQGNSSMLFEDLASYYMQDLKTKAKPTTICNRQALIDHYLIPAFSKLQADNITPAHIRQWQLSLSEQGLKNSTISTYHTQLTSIFKHAMKYYGLKENPCTIAGNIPKAKAHTIDYWTLEEFNSFIQAIRQHPIQITRHPTNFVITLFNTLFYTGIRKGELLALTIADFNPTEKALYINKTYHRINKQDIITTPKTNKSNRIVTLPNELCLMLMKHIDSLQDTSTTASIFPKVTTATIEKAITNYSEIAGIKRIRIHDIRHSHASMLINLGVQPLAISERLGHENIQTTLNIYAHLYPKTASEIANHLNTLMTNSIKTVSS